jgi:hypothetical protein
MWQFTLEKYAKFGTLLLCKTATCPAAFVTPKQIFFNLCAGTLGTAATTGLLYQPRMIGDGDCGAIGGMMIGRGDRSTRRKPVPVQLCPPQILHD